MFIVILWFGLLAFNIFNQRKKRSTQPSESELMEKLNQDSLPPAPLATHQAIFENFLVQFQKAQCYFSATIQIASLSYGIFDTNLLITFMLIPLATNGVLPVVFGLVLLFRQGKATMDVLLLTVASWVLASLVYWILYAHVIPINQHLTTDQQKYRMYQQFMYKLSAIPACGGYSALAVCPDSFSLGRTAIFDASHNLRVMTPIIWSFSTVCLFSILAGKFIKWRRAKSVRYAQVDTGAGDGANAIYDHPPLLRSKSGASAAYWFTTLCFLAGVGMQLSLLSIGTSLNMMDRTNWSFGQIVAVTIWAQPVLGYVYDELKELLWKRWRLGRVPK
jgi:hypothetical protein